MTLPPDSSPISWTPLPPTPIALRASMKKIGSLNYLIDEKLSFKKCLVENKTSLGQLIFTVFLIRMTLNLRFIYG